MSELGLDKEESYEQPKIEKLFGHSFAIDNVAQLMANQDLVNQDQKELQMQVAVVLLKVSFQDDNFDTYFYRLTFVAF